MGIFLLLCTQKSFFASSVLPPAFICQNKLLFAWGL